MDIFFGKIFRALFMALDDGIYGLAELSYTLFVKLSETGIFQPGAIQDFARRIYFFLGIAMLFKVSISIIDYIMNPDSIKDNKVGAGKLLKNIVIILVGIVTIPYIFQAAYSLQRIVLQENVIGKLIIGGNIKENTTNSSFIEESRDRMTFDVYRAFFHLTEVEIDGQRKYDDSCVADPRICKDMLKEELNANMVNDIVRAYDTNNMHKLTKFEILGATFKQDGKEYFVFDYMYFVTTLAGGFLAYIFLLFCFDIAVRAVKLGFLQLIAPVPLISKIDPKKGDEVFNKWVKECVTTYLVLFARLIAIYFAIYIISNLTDTYNIIDPNKDEKNLFVNVFIIFGVLLFVKDLPKLIKNLTGIDISGGTLSLNKRLRDVPILGKPTAEGIALGGRSIGNAGRGLVKGLKSKDMKGSMGAAWDDIRNDAKNYGHGMWAAGKQTLGINDRQLDRLEAAKARLLKKNADKESRVKDMKAIAADNEAIREFARKKVAESKQYADAKANVERLKTLADNLQKSGASQTDIDEAYANYAKAEKEFNTNANKNWVNDFIDSTGVFAGRDANPELDRKISDRDAHLEVLLDGEFAGNFAGKSAKEIDDYISNGFKDEINSIEHEIYADQQELAGIESEQKQIQEDVKSAKPYYTTKR